VAIYLYCLTEPGCEPPAELRGLAGEAVRVVAAAGRVAAWVSDLPEGLGPATAELARAHDRVVRAALAHETPLPARFGQSFASDAALRRELDSRTAALERSLGRVRGGVEMTVRVLLSGASGPETTGAGRSGPRAREGVHTQGEVETAGAAGVAGGAGGAGRAYMARLRERQQESAELKREAEFLQARVARAVDGLAREEVCSSVMPGAHSFSLSHLVAREAVGEYRLAVDSLVKSDPSLRMLVSGPWAPYSFARIAGE